MVTIDLSIGADENSQPNDDKYSVAFSDDGMDYVEENEISVARSDIPDWIYEIIPHIDYISHAEITLSENSEQLWVHEWEEGEIIITLFIPKSIKNSDNQYGSKPSDQNNLDSIAEKLAPLIQERSDRLPVGTEQHKSRNLNYLINKVNK